MFKKMYEEDTTQDDNDIALYICIGIGAMIVILIAFSGYRRNSNRRLEYNNGNDNGNDNGNENICLQPTQNPTHCPNIAQL